MIAHDSEITTTNLTTEERKMLAETLDDLFDAIAVQDHVEAALDNSAAGKIVRQLRFWGDHGATDDWLTYKVLEEWRLETRGVIRNRHRLKAGVDKLIAANLLEVSPEFKRPGDGRQAPAYRLNHLELSRLVYAAEVEILSDRLRRERRSAQVEKLTEKVRALEAALEDLDLVFGGERVETATEAEHDGYGDDEAPQLTDHDAPVDWLPEDLDDNFTPSDSVPLPVEIRHPTRRIPTPYPSRSDPLQKSNYTRERHEVTEESSFTTQTLPTERRLSAPPDVGDGFSNEPVGTTSTPSPTNSLDGNGTEEEASTDPPETTEPMNAREAWALYERGEVTLLEVERLCRPRGKEREVA